MIDEKKIIKEFRDLPKIDEFYDYVFKKYNNFELSDGRMKEIIRVSLDEMRESLKLKNEFSFEDMISILKSKMNIAKKTNLRKVINATGIVLHTNLGRSLLTKTAKETVAEIATNYVNLEYNIEEGRRGDRHSIVSNIIAEILGVEDAMVVNNNAGATMIVLSALAKNKQVIVSRGELIEIGGSFRIPDIMEQSKAVLYEVGTTNKTKISDYENAINENTAALLKVHTSNYKVIGFTEDVSLDELVELKKKTNIPLVHDIGSGLLFSLREYGIDEPTILDSVKAGVDVVLFSGDKLFGGPQCGIIAGKKEFIQKMKKDPLARVLRVDKMTFAALEATLKEYYDFENAKRNIPTLKMLCAKREELELKAKNLMKCIEDKNKNISMEILETENEVGGGSAPGIKLKSFAVAINNENKNYKLEDIETKLRLNHIAIIGYINKNRFLLDARTIDKEDFEVISEALSDL